MALVVVPNRGNRVGVDVGKESRSRSQLLSAKFKQGSLRVRHRLNSPVLRAFQPLRFREVDGDGEDKAFYV